MPDPNGSNFVRGAAVGFGPAEGGTNAAEGFRLLIVGDFGAPPGPPVGLRLSGEVPADLPGQVGVTVDMEVASALGAPGERLRLTFAAKRWSDWERRGLLASVPALRQAASLRDSVAAGRSPGALPPGLSRLEPLVHPPQTQTRPAAPPDDDLDRLLAMFEPALAPPAAGAAATLKERVAALDAAVAEQIAAIHADARFAALDAAWRGLRLLARRPLLGADVTIDLLSVADERPASVLLRDVAPDERQAGGSGLDCVLVAGAMGPDEDGLQDLGLCAAAGEAMGVPVIASLRHDFTEHPRSEAMLQAVMADDSAAWLAVGCGDVVLEAAGRAGPLWGEPGWAMAGLILAALAGPGLDRLEGPETMLDGLDVHEVAGRGGPVAWPLRDPARPAPAGTIGLAAQPNRDRVFVRQARTAGGRPLGTLLRTRR